MNESGPRRLVAALVGVGGLGVLALPSGADAATFTVNSTADGPAKACAASCTLRDALSSANGAAGADQVLFDASLSGQIKLTNGELAITDGVQLVGPGAAKVSVDGDGKSRVLRIEAPGSTSVSGLTISGGSAAPSYDGGGIFVNGSTAELNGLVVAGNKVTAGDKEANDPESPGGGIAAKKSDVTITGSTIANNTATGGPYNVAGGLFAEQTTLTIAGSTISGNTAAAPGGGMFTLDSYITVTNSTISGNASQGSFSYGGGWTDRVSEIDVSNSTIARNQAAGNGGGLYTASRSVALTNSIIADNSAVKAGPDVDGINVYSYDNPKVIQSSYSLIEVGEPALISDQGGTITGVDPALGGLASNGGPTLTHLPALKSPVVDQGRSSAGAGTDQRGATRPFDEPSVANAGGGDGADMGAVERQAGDSQTPPAGTPTGPSTTPDGQITDVDATVKKKQTQSGAKIKIKASVGAEEAITAKATGKIKVKGTKGQIKLKPQTKDVEAGERVVLKLKPQGNKSVKKVKRAIARYRDASRKQKKKLAVKAPIKIVATDAAGDTEIEKRVVKLT